MSSEQGIHAALTRWSVPRPSHSHVGRETDHLGSHAWTSACSTTSSTGCGSRRSRPGGGEPADLERAAEWAARARPRAPAARASSSPIDGGNPLAVGELRAATARTRPTVLIYGHYDVQSVGDAERVDDAAVRARRARRPPLRARRLRRQGQLPAAAARRVRAGARGRAAGQRARARRGRGGDRRRGRRRVGARRRARRRRGDRLRLRHGRRATRRRSPSALRGMVDGARSRCAPASATCTRACTAAARSTPCTCCTRCSPPWCPAPDGRLRDELRAGVAPPAEAERDVLGAAPAGRRGARRASARAPGLPRRRRGVLRAQRRRRRRWRSTRSSPASPARSCPPVAHASVSLRLAPGQTRAGDRRHARAPAARRRCPPGPSSS